MAVFCFLLASGAVRTAELTIPEGEGCVDSCHTILQGDLHVLENPSTLDTGCGDCHRSTLPGAHEFSFTAVGGELCTGCHDKLTQGSHVHVPAGAGLCTTCHQIHNPSYVGHLKSSRESLCQTCHINIVRANAHTSHLPVEEGKCVMCHDPHSSNYDDQLKLPVPELCFQCHDQEQHDRSGRLLPAIKPLYDDESLEKHPAFARGQCLLCHEPHASDNYRLQKQPYPESLYARFTPDTYFCVQCHGTKTFTETRTLDATKFRNGNFNLHDRHVNRSKGRSCRTCHEHHASKRPFLITEKVTFGERYIEIVNYERTATGGSCSPSCHQTMKYDRVVPAVNRFLVTERAGKDASPEELARGATLPDGEAVYEKRCLGCHGSSATGRVGPNIQGASTASIDSALDSSPMMWILRSLTSNEVESVSKFLRSRVGMVQPATTTSGESLFATICAGCHGSDGTGDVGPDIVGVGMSQIKEAIQAVTIMKVLEALTEEELLAITNAIPGASAAESDGQIETLLDGQLLFTTRCSGCHGTEATGGLGGMAPDISSASVELIKDAIGRIPMMIALASLTGEEIEAVSASLPGNNDESAGLK